MSSKLLIESGPHETRVAVLEDGQVVEIYIERSADRAVVGNIYKGRISRVVPGIEAAFVNIGLTRDAFLFAADLQRPRDSGYESADRAEEQGSRSLSISSVLAEGQELLVQVVKEPLPGKGARISSQISLPGRFLVLLPEANGIGISRRITDVHERERLESLLTEGLTVDAGLIARTAAAGRSAAELERELKRLQKVWRDIRRSSAGARAPALVHEELDLPLRAVRDYLDQEVEEVWVEGKEAAERIVEHLRETDPAARIQVRSTDANQSLFERFGVERSVARALQRKIWLESGGFIVIDHTEALVAIDVNSGRNTDSAELETTALRTNLEAAKEVAHQLRLRDLSGIIVVDFIDMSDAENRARLLATFEQELIRDRVRAQVSTVSEFGLVAVTRKRMRGGVLQRLTRPCPCCSGEGRIKSAVTVALELGRALVRQRQRQTDGPLIVKAHPELVAALKGDQRELLETLTRETGIEIELVRDPDLRPDGYEIQVV